MRFRAGTEAVPQTGDVRKNIFLSRGMLPTATLLFLVAVLP